MSCEEGESLCLFVKRLDNLFARSRNIEDIKEQIIQELSAYRFNFRQNSKYLNFSPHRYTRNLVALKENYSLILNCWDKNQKSPKKCCSSKEVCNFIKVIHGSLKLNFNNEDQSTSELIISNNDKIQFHRNSDIGEHSIENITPIDEKCQGKAISLHLYTPPHVECNSLRNDDRSSSVPVIFCCDSTDKIDENKDIELATALKDREVFTNLNTLVEVLRKEIRIDDLGKHSNENINHVKDLLRLFHFNDLEWKQYANFAENRYTRNLIGYHSKFTMLLLCWEKGQMSPIHDHAGSNCWVKVLEGNLQEEVYSVNEDKDTVSLKHVSIYSPDQVTYISDNIGVHKMGNGNSDKVAVSLHVYSPPYHKCHLFDQSLGIKKEVSITTAYGTTFPFMKKCLMASGNCDKIDIKEDIKQKEVEKEEEQRQEQQKQEEEREVEEEVSSQIIHDLNSYLENLSLVCKESLCQKRLDSLLNSLQLSNDEWEKYIHFSPDRYTRNLITINENYSLILNCFWNGQKTPVHDHGTTGKVWIKVLDGTLTINQYNDARDQIINQITLNNGDHIILSNKELGYHETMNGNADQSCISLHLYSPPYLECSFVCSKTNQIRQIPVAYCSLDEKAKEKEEIKEETNGENRTKKLEIQCKFSKNVFTNFSSFLDLLTYQFASCENQQNSSSPSSSSPIDHPPSASSSSSSLSGYFSNCPIDNITQIINRIQFHPKEWMCYATSCSRNYTRNLVAKGNNISVYLNVFKPGQSSKIHDHGGSRSWIKVLDGELSETQFRFDEKKYLIPHIYRTIKVDNTVALPYDVVHKTENKTDKFVFSLHIYFPDYDACKCYEESTGSVSTLFCDCHLTDYSKVPIFPPFY